MTIKYTIFKTTSVYFYLTKAQNVSFKLRYLYKQNLQKYAIIIQILKTLFYLTQEVQIFY